MGFRFTIESANNVANLTCGKVVSCYDAICSSYTNYTNFLYFLETFSENFYSDRRTKYEWDVQQALWLLREKKNYICEIEREINLGTGIIDRDEEVLFALKRLSQILGKCKIKSLLLPGIEGFKQKDEFMTSERTLQKLLRWHRGTSCLILQPEEPTYKDVSVFDAFPHFDVALKQIDEWPAVLFWDKNNYVFVPVSSEGELVYLYKTIGFEQNAISWLKNYASFKAKPSHYYFHLSDLHFGAKNVITAERRLDALLDSEVKKLGFNDEIDFIITGDAVDSPTDSNYLNYKSFAESLESKSGKEPMFVLGNHDVNVKGLALGKTSQNISSCIGHYPQIKVVDEIETAFLLFNSNTGGKLAEGKIGKEQMAEMGNLLDKDPKLSQYKLIAVLHHHIKPIDKPDFYGELWYQKLLPEAFLEKTLRLVDADIFIEWLNSRNVRIVLHGHKHIPFITEYEGIHMIACGSSTGQIAHKNSEKTYLSYNLLKFDANQVVCTQFAEDTWGAGSKNIHSQVIDY